LGTNFAQKQTAFFNSTARWGFFLYSRVVGLFSLSYTHTTHTQSEVVVIISTPFYYTVGFRQIYKKLFKA